MKVIYGKRQETRGERGEERGEREVEEDLQDCLCKVVPVDR